MALGQKILSRPFEDCNQKWFHFACGNLTGTSREIFPFWAIALTLKIYQIKFWQLSFFQLLNSTKKPLRQKRSYKEYLLFIQLGLSPRIFSSTQFFLSWHHLQISSYVRNKNTIEFLILRAFSVNSWFLRPFKGFFLSHPFSHPTKILIKFFLSSWDHYNFSHSSNKTQDWTQ